MNFRHLLIAAFFVVAPIAVGQELPPPEKRAPVNPPIPPQGPALVAPQNAAQNQAAAQGAAVQAPAAQPAPKNTGKSPEFFKARRAMLAARKEAKMERMRKYKEAQAIADEKAYQDWHDRYLADTPVREQYYRALASYYDSGSAVGNIRTAYPYAWGSPVVLPEVPVYYAPIYAPICEAPIYGPSYGTFFYWGW